MTDDEPEPTHVQDVDHVPAVGLPLDDAVGMARVRADFLDLFDREYPLVVRFVIRSGAPPHEAEEAVQDAFADAWARALRHPRRWKEIRDPGLWIRIVARNKHRGSSASREPPTVTVADVPVDRKPIADHADLTTRTLDVLTALRELDEEARTVMALHLDGYSCAELGRSLGMTEQGVRDALRRARKGLGVKLSIAPTSRRPMR